MPDPTTDRELAAVRSPVRHELAQVVRRRAREEVLLSSGPKCPEHHDSTWNRGRARQEHTSFGRVVDGVNTRVGDGP